MLELIESTNRTLAWVPGGPAALVDLDGVVEPCEDLFAHVLPANLAQLLHHLVQLLLQLQVLVPCAGLVAKAQH